MVLLTQDPKIQFVWNLSRENIFIELLLEFLLNYFMTVPSLSSNLYYTYMYVEKTIVYKYMILGTIHGFRHPRALEHIPYR